MEKYGDFKKVETAIGTGPFTLERYEPNVKTIFKRNPEYFLKDLPWVDGVEWLVLDDPSTALAMYRTGQIDAGPEANWNVRQQDLDSLKKSHPHLHYLDWLSLVTQDDLPAERSAPLQRRARQAGHLAGARSPGDPRGGVCQG